MKKCNKYICLLVLFYIAAHWALIIVSGIWWDDWVIWENDINTIKEMFHQAGGPWGTYIAFSVMWIPSEGYRVIVFFMFLLGGILFYKMLVNIDDLFTKEDAFWITAVYLTAPVNDARITLICYTYTLSLFLFLLAFYLLSTIKNISNEKRKIVSFFSLIFLFCSYMTQSLLVMTGLIWIYLFYICWKNNKEKNIMKKVMIYFHYNWDFLILPFVFFLVKNIFFKPYGSYTGYNNITIQSLIQGIAFLPGAAIKTLGNIIYYYGYIKQINLKSICAMLLVIVAIFLIRREKNGDGNYTIHVHQNLTMFLVGIIVYIMGVFPYILIRNGQALENVGVGGRDTILAGFGISIMAYYFLKIIHIPKPLRDIVLVLICVLGVLHFNDWYLNYQEDWYQQLQFADEISENAAVEQENTFLCDFLYSSPCNGTRFYSLNGMSYRVTGKKDKFYFTGQRDLHSGIVFNEELLNGKNADDYDASDLKIDGVFLIRNEPIENMEILKMRFEELFRPDDFNVRIHEMKDIDYIKIDKETSDKIYQAYLDNKYNSSILYDYCCQDED